MDIAALHHLFLSSTGVTTDSRNCLEGSLFFALKGESFNGNTFAKQALEKGCAYAVVDESLHATEGDDRFIVVDNVLSTLQQLANYHRRQFNGAVIGITGTNGKTTTKELMAAVLTKSYRVLYTLGNLNNQIGVPLTLLRLTPEYDMAIIEMGASHPGDIKELVDIAEPDYGLITNVGKAHLEGFGSFEGVVKTKGELYDFLRQREGSVLFIHEDNPYLTTMAEGMNRISYGTTKIEETPGGYYINGKVADNSTYLSVAWRAEGSETVHLAKTQLIGIYNLDNVLAAITVGRYFGVSDELIDEALAEYTPQNNRSQLKNTESNTLIIDAYNANPTSMMASLENFNSMEAEHKMLIIGDMKELGEDSAAEHQKIIDFIDTCPFESVALVGDLFAATRHNYTSYRNVDNLIEALKQQKPEGKTILIKGSNSIKLIRTVEYL